MSVALNIIEEDLKYIWHPCSQMKDYETLRPIIIERAKGIYLETSEGKKIIDAISSWWCKSLGHGHPQLKKALIEQMEKFEHVIFANTTNTTITQLSKKLSQLTSNLNKMFFAGDGSCAVEVALKMSLHARQIRGETKKQHFIALANGYHGETLGALSVSDLGIYRDPYRAILFPVTFLQKIPYVSGKEDPLWHDCSSYWPDVLNQLTPLAEQTTAMILEPIVQGSGGMLIYSQDFLKRLKMWADQNNIHLIADECMTGLGRTGLALACDHAKIEPDFLILSKGLTAGWLPMSVVLTSDSIYQLFYDDYEKGKSFLHSHTHSGNALAASVALATLQIIQQQNIYKKVETKEKLMKILMEEIACETKKIKNIRCIGGVVAADLIAPIQQRTGFAVFRRALELGAWLRPLSNTIYWTPPFIITDRELEQLTNITKITIKEVLN